MIENGKIYETDISNPTSLSTFNLYSQGGHPDANQVEAFSSTILISTSASDKKTYILEKIPNLIWFLHLPIMPHTLNLKYPKPKMSNFRSIEQNSTNNSTLIVDFEF